MASLGTIRPDRSSRRIGKLPLVPREEPPCWSDRWGSPFAAESCVGASHPHFSRMNRSRAASFASDFARPLSRQERIARIDALATLMDTAFVLPGTEIRFGLDALIGLVPGIGDAITTVMSLFIVSEARVLGAPRTLIARMLANVALDGLVGAVPLAGDMFDVAFRANRRNMALLRAHLEKVEGPAAPYWSPGARA
jgi:hypothetical protein